MSFFSQIPPHFLWVLGLILAFTVVKAVFAHIQSKKRRLDLGDMAEQMGMRFDPGKERSFDSRYPFFEALRKGKKRYAFNTLTGAFDGREIVGFDYHYETSSGSGKRRSRTSHYFSAVILACDVPISGLTIRPEGLFDRMKQFIGFDDINFESAEFSKRFHIASKDREVAYDVVQPETMDILLTSPRFHLHFEQGFVMAMRKERFQPGDYRDAIRLIDDILDRIPRSAHESLAM